MHIHALENWTHRQHHVLPETLRAERRTRWVTGLTLSMMGVELVAGYHFGSMALVADGWHMGSHATALGISAFAYQFSRAQAHNQRFTFGTGKVGPLAGFTSAVVLAMVALLMVGQSLERLWNPIVVQFDEAILVAVVGLVVNVVSALMLSGHPAAPEHRHSEDAQATHGQTHDHPHDHDHGHDHNLQSAYLHVLADALTSVLAIVALLAGKWAGWVWMDPIMGLVGAALISRWAWGLLRDTGKVLLDAEDNQALGQYIHQLIEADGESRLADLHLWRVSPISHACVISVVCRSPRPADDYKQRLVALEGLEHVAVEVRWDTP